METLFSWVVVALFIANVALIAYMAFLALKIKNGPVAHAMGYVRPIVTRGKAIAATGRRAAEENRDRLQALSAEIKGIAEAVRPGADGAAPPTRINYRTLFTALAVLGNARRGWAQIQQARKPTANPPGPAKAKKKAPPRRLGPIPEVVRLLLDVRRALR